MGYSDKDKQRAFQVAWREARRIEFIDSKGGKCVKCKSIDRLEVDHIDKTLKTMNPTRIWSRRKEVRDAELANCQVLCYGCHKEKTISERYVEHPHGIYAKYKYGCRCELCRSANASRAREQRASRKNG
jgi:5-methylcytosine-specific restriction endonuclease McrA